MNWNYLTYALLTLAAHLLLVAVVVLWRHRSVRFHGPLLRLRERNLIEAEAIDVIYERILIDPAFRRQFITQCLRLHCASTSTKDAKFDDIAPERLERFVVYVVRNLDDHQLLQLLHLLRIPLHNERLAKQHQRFEQTLPRCNGCQKMLIGLGFACLLLMLLLPPWHQRHERKVHVISGPNFQELLDSKTLGYRWIWDANLPRSVTANIDHADLRTSERHIHRPAVNYLQLTCQIAAATILNGCLVWNVRKTPPTIQAERRNQQLASLEA